MDIITHTCIRAIYNFLIFLKYKIEYCVSFVDRRMVNAPDMNTYNLYYDTWVGFYISDKPHDWAGTQTVELIYNVKNVFTIVKYQGGSPETIRETTEIVGTYAKWGSLTKHLYALRNLKDEYTYTFVDPDSE